MPKIKCQLGREVITTREKGGTSCHEGPREDWWGEGGREQNKSFTLPWYFPPQYACYFGIFPTEYRPSILPIYISLGPDF